MSFDRFVIAVHIQSLSVQILLALLLLICVQPDRSYIVQIGGQELSPWDNLGEMVGLFLR